MSFIDTLVDATAALLRQLFGGTQASVPTETTSDGSTPPPSGDVVQAGSVAPAVPEAPAGAGPRRINAAGLALVKASEGLRLTAYQDQGGVFTIGYGNTEHATPGLAITEGQAEEWLLDDLASAEGDVAQYAPPSLTDNQFSALVSFTFNLGGPALRTLLSHGVDEIPSQLLRWDRIGEREIPGLLARRQREAALWNA
jgi:lysozyme